MIDTEFVKNTKLLEKGRDLKDWYIFRDEKHYGPFSYDDVSNFIKSDLIQMRHHIWRPGFDVWMRVEDLSELSCLQDSKAPRKNLTDNDFESLFTEEIAVTEDMDFDAPESPNAQQVDINTKNKNSLIVLSVIFSVAFSGLLYVFMNSKDDLYSFARLPDVQKSKLEIISESPIKGSADIRFQSYLSKMNTGDPVIVFSTNLPKDTEIEYNLKGVEGTLVGLHRYADSKIAYVPSDKIFESKPLRRSTGEYIPAGVYSLFVSCTKCENEVSFKDKIEYYPKGKIQYKKDINQFNESVRYNAKLELGELEQITTNVKQQFDETRKAFEKRKNSNSWDNFSRQWLSDQEELINLFAQLKNTELREKIYFLEMYEELKVIVRGLFEMHMMQDKIVAKNTKTKSYNRIKNEIDSSISAFDSKINIEKLNLKKSDFISGR